MLDREEITQHMSSLAIKYGITLNEQDYINSSNEIVRSFEKNKIFGNRINGIGQDDVLELNQKQSGNEAGLLAIGLNKIATSNTKNEGRLEDLNFLVWGDNNLSAEKFTEGNEDTHSTLQRKWLAQTTGTESPPTQVMFNASKILNREVKDLYLVISPSGEDKFLAKETQVVKSSSITEKGFIVFDKVQWDKDRSGSDLFTFINADSPLALRLDSIGKLSYANGMELFKVFPNLSVDGYFNVEIKFKETQKAQLHIYDHAGRLMTKEQLEGDKHYVLQNEHLPGKGLYNVVLHVSDFIYERRLIIQ